MTKITYTRHPKVSLTVDGHCNAPRQSGHDLCCAAVSMLSLAFVGRIENLKVADKVICLGDGYAHAEFAPRGKNGKRGIEAMNTILTGFMLLREKYPDNIKITGGKNE